MKVYLLVVVFVVIGMTSCYSPVEGCLDPEAKNYSIAGDEDCDDCCTYPLVNLSIYHQNGDTTFFLGDTLVNNLGQEYSIIKYVYFLSDFKIQTSEGVIEVQDSLQLNVDEGTIWVKDDVIRVSRSTFTYALGTAIFDGGGEELTFTVGLSEALSKNRFTSEISKHPITTDPDSLYREEFGDYVFQRIQVAQGDSLRDTVLYDILERTQEITVPVNFESIRGSDKKILIEALYNKWFEDVDFSSMPKEEIEAAIYAKTGQIFRMRE